MIEIDNISKLKIKYSNDKILVYDLSIKKPASNIQYINKATTFIKIELHIHLPPPIF